MPTRLEAIRMFIKRQQEMMSPLFGDLLYLLKVTLLSGSLYLVMLFFWFDAGRNFLTIDEALYLSWGVRWASGDYYIYPLYGDRILFFFLVSIFFRLFGVSLGVGRWVVHLFGVGLLVITYYIGKEVYGERVGILAMLILMFSGFFQLLSYYALTDIPSIFFFAVTIFFFMKAFKYKSQRASFWGGVFCVLGAFSKLSYFAIFPILGILWLKRLAKKELTLRETRKLITSALIIPLSVIIIVLLTYQDLFFDALQLGLVPFAKEATSGEFLRERLASLFGLRQNVTTLSYLIKTLLFPNLGSESLRGVLSYFIREIVFPKPIWVSQIIDQYYEIERWILLTVFLLSLLYRRTRSFDMLAWIVTYGFIWLILAPSVGRIYIVEISDRYLYPLIPAIYIQFSCLIFLFLDKIRALQGGVSSFDYAIRAFKNKKLFIPLTAVLLGFVIWRAANLSMFLIIGAISVFVFLKIGKEQGEKRKLTFILISLATIFLVISNLSLQIQFFNAFIYSTPIQEVSYGIPADLLAHEEIRQFEEGIWGKLSYAHLPPTPYTEKIFLQDPLHTPGNFSGLYIWFSKDRTRDRVEMYVRWITDDSSTPKTFSGHFQGTNVIFSMVSLVDCEKIEGDKIYLEGNNYLKFSGTVLGDDLDGFDLILDFIPNQNNYYIDWDLFRPRDPDHVFLGSMSLAKFANNHFPIPPHQISFSTYSLQLKWRGLNRLVDRTVFFNISYNELLVTEWSGVNWTDDYDMLIRTWTNDKKPLPIGNYLLWGTFSETLKEVELIVHGSKHTPHLKMNILVDWNQTDPSYVHIGMNRRNLPFEIDFYSTEEIHNWSISESFRSFFERLPFINWTFYKSLILVWLICIILINASDKIIPKNRITLKLKNNQLAAYFCWLVLGSFFLSSISVITHEVPFWWDSIAHDFYEAFNLSFHSAFFFWFVFEELILVGTLVLGVWFILSDSVNLIMEKKNARIAKITHLNKATTVSLQNFLELVKRNPTELPDRVHRITIRIQKFLMTIPSRMKNILSRIKNRLIHQFSQKKKKLDQIKRVGKALIFTFLIILTFFLVMQHNTRYLSNITILQEAGYHDSLRKGYKFLEEYGEDGDQIMIHQTNWGMWYTKNKFSYLPLLRIWTLDWIWATILAYNVKFVVISEWEDYHPFYLFEDSQYAPNFPILWSYIGTVEFRTTIYAVKQ